MKINQTPESLNSYISNSNSNIINNSEISSVSKNEYSLNLKLKDLNLNVNTENIGYANILKDNNIEINKENINKLDNLKNKLSKIKKNISQEKLSEFFSKNINIDNLDLNNLADLFDKNFNTKEDENTTPYEEITDINMDGIDENELKKYGSILQNHNISVSLENIDQLKSIFSQLEKLSDVDRKTAIELIKNNVSLNIGNINSYRNLNVETTTNTISSKVWEKLSTNIEKMFNDINIDISNKNLDIAKSLIENDIPITKDNLLKFDFLETLSTQSPNIITKNLPELLDSGKNLNNIELFNSQITESEKIYLKNKYDSIKNNLNNITNETISNIISSKLPINLENLTSIISSDTTKNNYTNIENSIIKTQLELATIQLKMTNEAILRLSGKGIDINTKPLIEAIETLNNIEKEIASKSLKSENIPQTEENIDNLINISNSIPPMFKSSAYHCIKEVINNEIDYTISSINNTYKNKEILETLQVLATTPSLKHGDTYKNVEAELENVLNSQNIPTTDENIKYTKILSLNNIDVNEQNLLKVKDIDIQISNISNNLHPKIAVNMLKDGLNPLNTNIKDLSDYINKFSNKNVETSKEKIAEHFVKLQETTEFTQAEQVAVKSIYRMLNIIERFGSASIGVIINTKSDLTLENLMEASRRFEKNRKGERIDITVDNKTGILEELIIPDNSIKGSITKILSENKNYNNNEEFIDNLIKNAINEANPNATVTFIKQNPNYNKATLQEFINSLEEINNENKFINISQSKANQLLQDLQNINLEKTSVIDILKNNNIPLTISNLANVSKLMESNHSTAREINKLNKSSKSSIKTNNIEKLNLFESESINNAYSNIYNNLDDLQQDFLNDDNRSPEEINILLMQQQSLKKLLSLQQVINNSSNNSYQVPISLKNGDITNLNIYILNKNISSNNMSVLFSLETSNLGVIQSHLKLENNDLSITLNSNNKEATEFLKQIKNKLIQSIETYNLSQLTIAEETEKNIFLENQNLETPILTNNSYFTKLI